MNRWADGPEEENDDEISDELYEEMEQANKEAFAAMANDAAPEQIRREMICGHCKAATFLVWDAEPLDKLGGKEDIVRREERRNLTRFKLDGDEENFPPGALWKTFLVRCSFFRMNVPDPARVVNCEAFRQRKSTDGG